jgi:hypothetical protein
MFCWEEIASKQLCALLDGAFFGWVYFFIYAKLWNSTTVHGPFESYTPPLEKDQFSPDVTQIQKQAFSTVWYSANPHCSSAI